MSNTGQPYTGPLTFDVTTIAPILVDQPPGALRGMRREQPGMAEVVQELAVAIPSVGGTAGVPQQAYQQFVDRTDKLARIRQHRDAILKMAEVLNETEATYEDEREQALAQIVDAVRSTARRTKTPAILAPFEQSIRYHAQAATKAVKTRNKRKAAEKPATG